MILLFSKGMAIGTTRFYFDSSYCRQIGDVNRTYGYLRQQPHVERGPCKGESTQNTAPIDLSSLVLLRTKKSIARTPPHDLLSGWGKRMSQHTVLCALRSPALLLTQCRRAATVRSPIVPAAGRLVLSASSSRKGPLAHAGRHRRPGLPC